MKKLAIACKIECGMLSVLVVRASLKQKVFLTNGAIADTDTGSKRFICFTLRAVFCVCFECWRASAVANGPTMSAD